VNGTIKKYQGNRGVSWYAKFSVTGPATGKRVHRRVSAATNQTCKAMLRDAIKMADGAQFEVDDWLTVRDFIDRWLATTVRPSTHRRY
jgi:hypothetical protein